MEETPQSSDDDRNQDADGEKTGQGSCRERSNGADGKVRSRSSNGKRRSDNDDFSEYRIDGDDFNVTLRKRRIAEQTQIQDRISALPDEILIHILSFLPAEDAIKTGTLSLRWLYLWTSVSNLDFGFSFARPSALLSFIDQTLIFRMCCNVKKISLKFPYETSFAFSIDAWVRFPMMRANLEEVCQFNGLPDTVTDGVNYILTQHVYTNSSITKLNLFWCELAPNGLISWKSLKNLSIGYSKLSEDIIQKILVGSPSLEFLELCGFNGFNRLDIRSASLQKLVLRDYWDSLMGGDDPMLEISAPNLQSLGILGSMYRMKFRLMNVQSLVDCKLDFILNSHTDYEVRGNILRELLHELRHVNKLFVGNLCIEVLSTLAMKALFFPVSKHKHLILETQLEEYESPGIAGLLQSSPYLETLVIDMTFPNRSMYWFNKNVPKHYWTSQEWSSKCSMTCLNTVEIVGFSAWHLGYDHVIQLVKFLLESSARVLEKVVIQLGKNGLLGPSAAVSFRVNQSLLLLRRSSPRAVILLSRGQRILN